MSFGLICVLVTRPFQHGTSDSSCFIFMYVCMSSKNLKIGFNIPLPCRER